jgi:hypothetical protein
MSKRDVVALVVLAVSGVVVGVGCLATYGVLREYADVCGETGPVEQVWLGGAGLGPLVAGIAVVLALVVAFIGRRRGVRVAAAGLVILALIGATAGGAAGVSGKKAAWEKNPATYGVCGGYNS